jgi:hypothetical protein
VCLDSSHETRLLLRGLFPAPLLLAQCKASINFHGRFMTPRRLAVRTRTSWQLDSTSHSKSSTRCGMRSRTWLRGSGVSEPGFRPSFHWMFSDVVPGVKCEGGSDSVGFPGVCSALCAWPPLSCGTSGVSGRISVLRMRVCNHPTPAQN